MGNVEPGEPLQHPLTTLSQAKMTQRIDRGWVERGWKKVEGDSFSMDAPQSGRRKSAVVY